MQKTAIEWCDFSANPLKFRRKSDNKVVWGCVKVSPGCAHCYSEAIALRFDRGKLFNARNMEELEPFLDEKELREMLTKKTVGGVAVSGSKVFVGDMTDVCGEWVSDELLDRLFAVFALRSDVIWQVLTKRAERLRGYLSASDREGKINALALMARPLRGDLDFAWPLPNVWLGVSVEDQQRADERIPHLLQTPAAVRFLSVEPLLAPVHLDGLAWPPMGLRVAERERKASGGEGDYLPQGVNWVIVGGESGPGARPFDLDWAVAILKQCRAADVPPFMKQVGSNPVFCGHSARGITTSVWGPIKDKKGGLMEEWPLDLRVRQFPEGKGV